MKHIWGLHSRVTQEDADQWSKISIVAYGLFLAAMILDIGGAFGLKYASFAFLLIYLLAFSLADKIKIPPSFFVLEGGLFFIAPLFFLILAIYVYSVEPATAFREMLPFSIWLLFPLLLNIKPKEKLISIFAKTLFFGAIFIIIIFIIILTLHFLGQVEQITRIYLFALENGLGYFGAKPSEDIAFFFPNVYPRWTLLLIPAAIFFFREDMKRFVVIFLAVLLTTSTAAILFLLLGVIWASFDRLEKGKLSKINMKKLAFIFFLLLLIALPLYLLGFGGIMEFIVSKLGDSPSTSIKLGHIASISAIMSKNIGTLFFGMGVGSSFWSVGSNQFASNVEVSHFNLMRQFGLPYALAFFSYVLFIFTKLYHMGDEIGRVFSIGLMTLFVAAGTNPVLISPIFLLVLVISRSYISLAAREKYEYHIKVNI